MNVPFLDLNVQHRQINKELAGAVKRVIKRGDFILGQDVGFFEKEFACFCQTKYAVGLNSGTDALFLGLLSLGIGAGDEVIVPVFTFIATANAVSYTGAKPVFVDIDEGSYCLDPDKLEKAITRRTKAIIAVHLYGHPADMEPILKIAKKYNLKVIEDAAQAHGAIYKYKGKSKKAGSMADMGCFSFYPTKNLGACGDAGAVVTDNETIYKKLLLLRDCGRVSKYEHKIIGYNSRLDTLQAAILRVKLKKLDNWNQMRRKKARLYSKILSGIEGLILPKEKINCRHVYHLYVLRVKDRKGISQMLSSRTIPFLLHYPIPLHLQEAYRSLGYKKGDFPVAERIAQEVISLPLYPHLAETQLKFIADTLKKALEVK